MMEPSLQPPFNLFLYAHYPPSPSIDSGSSSPDAELTHFQKSGMTLTILVQWCARV